MIEKKDIRAFGQTDRVILRETDFVYLLPHPALRSFVSNYTVTFPSRKIISDRYTVIPHGSATLVFSFDRNGWYGNLFGPMTRPCMVGGQANQSELLLIVEFQPAGLSAFTGIPQKELANRTIPFAAIHPPLNRSLLEALERAGDLAELTGALDGRLLESLCFSYPSALRTAAGMTLERAGRISCKELSASVYYSERHLNRMFDHYWGMSSKTFSRMVRINRAIRLIRNPRCSIAYAANEMGFYDPPHFIHEFQSVCGITPQAYRQSMSDFYSEIAKF